MVQTWLIYINFKYRNTKEKKKTCVEKEKTRRKKYKTKRWNLSAAMSFIFADRTKTMKCLLLLIMYKCKLI